MHRYFSAISAKALWGCCCSSSALLRIVNFRKEKHAGVDCRSEKQMRIYVPICLPSSLWVEVCFQVVIAGCVLTAVCHHFLCFSSVSGRYFEQKHELILEKDIIIDGSAVVSLQTIQVQILSVLSRTVTYATSKFRRSLPEQQFVKSRSFCEQRHMIDLSLKQVFYLTVTCKYLPMSNLFHSFVLRFRIHRNVGFYPLFIINFTKQKS